jgi:hypothetical protein
MGGLPPVLMVATVRLSAFPPMVILVTCGRVTGDGESD